MAEKVQLTVAGFFKNLARISDFVSKAATRAGLDERGVYAVQMAVDEACTNVIEHAYGGEGQGQIRLICHIQPDGLQITIYDQGRPFDPDEVPELNTQAPLSERVEGGMGIFFIRRLVDTVEYKFNTPQGNQLILFKRREPSL
jgi:anti-sigma regulatory factor (Ser/Thr protein kinase)